MKNILLNSILIISYQPIDSISLEYRFPEQASEARLECEQDDSLETDADISECVNAKLEGIEQ